MDLDARRAGIRTKVLRASEHLLTLTQQEALYVATGEYGPRTAFEDTIPERGGQSGLACRAHIEPPPPPSIGVLCGDVVHNLRSALDHLANALVAANGGTPLERPGGTQFPIRVVGHVMVKSGLGPGISDIARQILEEAQPRAATEPLALLNELSNVDKHRALNLIVVTLHDVHVFDVPEQLRAALKEETEPFDREGQLIYSILGGPDDLGESWHGMGYSGALAFGDLPGGPPIVTSMRQMLEFVRDHVVERFARACLGGSLGFPKPPFG